MKRAKLMNRWWVRPKYRRVDLEQIDGARLRDMGLNPEDFRDAQAGRRTSLLFKPFRDAPPE
jgi:hypothetical protein